MAYVHKFGAVKYFFVFLAFDISTHEAAHPVIRDSDGGEDLELAE
jgi:hypothetical protein